MKAKTIEEINTHYDKYGHYNPVIVVLCKNVTEYYFLKNEWGINHLSYEDYVLECLDNQEEVVFFYDDNVDAEGPSMYWQHTEWFDDINENCYIIVDLNLYKKWIAAIK